MKPQDKLKILAKDLAREFPRSPRETLAGYVIAARAVDKCRVDAQLSLQARQSWRWRLLCLRTLLDADPVVRPPLP